MNAVEQRKHTTAVQTIGGRVDDLETVLDAHIAHTEQLRASAQQRLDRLEQFTARTVWQRLRWLVTGR